MKYQTILFDADGVTLKEGQRFSNYYSEHYHVPLRNMTPFFSGPFKKCLIGQADLKEELARVLREWQWQGTVDELLEVWFSTDNELNEDVAGLISTLRSQGTACYLATNQEKYRGLYFQDKLRGLFDGFFISAEIGHKKDEVAFYEHVFNNIQSSVEKSDILLIDDDPVNIATASSVGIDTHLFKNFQHLLQASQLRASASSCQDGKSKTEDKQ